jgi:alkylhydroperoxidase family enzyme
MARVPLIDPEDVPELSDFVDKIRSGRRGNVINVYRTLLHSPPLAESWFEHINKVRWGTEIDGRLREIVIIRLGHLVASAYVLRQHVPKLAAGEGMTEDECNALTDWKSSDFFSAAECATLAYVDAMTRDIVVSDDVFEPLRGPFTARQIVELTLMIGAYIAHARVLQALEVDLESDDTAGI